MGFPAPQVDFQRAPLGPGYLLVPFLWAFGDDVGTKVWTSIFSVFPLLPCAALLARRLMPRNQALVATGLLMFNPWNWEQVVTGALPAIGIGLLFLILWGLIPVMGGKGTRWDKVAIVGGIGIIPYINHTSTGLAAVALPVFLLATMLLVKSWRPLTPALPWVGLGCLLALPAIALFYADVLFGSARISYPGPKIFVPVGATAAWLIFVYAVPLTFASLGKSHALAAGGLVLFAYATLGLFSSYDEAIINILYRSQYIASALLILLGVPYVATALASQTHRAKIVVTTTALIFIATGSMFIWRTQPIYSDIMTPDMVAVARMIPTEYEGNVLVNTFPMGMWLAAIEARPTKWLFQAEPPAMYAEEYAFSRCVLAWENGCDPIGSAQQLGVKYVLLNSRTPFGREPNYWKAPPRDALWQSTEAAPWLRMVGAKGTFRLWEVVG